MIAVVQRVTEASVDVEATGYHASISAGLCILLGVEQGDTEAEARWMAGKLSRLRIFRDDQNKMNRSVADIEGQVLLISQFTLAGNCDKGNRPSFVNAAAPELGEKLYELVAELLGTEHGLPTLTGQFGAMMKISLINDGPVTLVVSKRPHDSSS